MKKSLIALAALSAFATAAQAQSSVTVYGLVDVGYTEFENKSTASGSTTTAKGKSTGNGDGGLATSRLGVRGTEDLGAGLKANFVLEYDLVDVGTGGNGQTNAATTTGGAAYTPNGATAAAAAGFGARYSWVGLEDAKLGQLRLGRQEQSIHSVMVGGSAGGANNVTGALYSAGLGDVSTNSASVRPHLVFVNRAVTYISPVVNGFRVEVQTASQELDPGTGAANKISAKETGASLKYAAGKFSAAYAMATSKLDAANTANDAKLEQQAINATYDLGVAKVFALYAQRKDTLNGALYSDTKNTELGVQVPMGKTVLFASAFEGDRTGPGTTATVAGLANANADTSGYQVGAIYNLSKRTAAYAIYGNQEIKGTGAVAGAKVESTATSVGVRHSF
jgi:general bacterial porin, GBP family